MFAVSLKPYKKPQSFLCLYQVLGTRKLLNHLRLQHGTAQKGSGKLREADVSKHAPAWPLNLAKG